MDNSIYITLTRQLALFRDLEATANNVANTNTTGFNAEHVLFSSYMAQDANQGDTNPMSFGYDVSTYRDASEGELKATGNDLDVAIEGNGYFVVQTPLGLRYTRAGNFRVDPDGTLVTVDGYPVMDPGNKPIVFGEDAHTIKIGEAGNIAVNGADYDILNVVQFENPKVLERLNGSLFKSNVTPHPAESARVVQGMLEGSNVQPVKELTHMVTVQHDVTDTAQLIGVVYDMERKAADAWAQQS